MIASIAEDGETRSAPFGHALVKLAEQRPEVVGMTADLSKYTDLHIFARAYPERFFQMGMAEQLLMGAAGEWQRGVYSLRHDICGLCHPSCLRFYSSGYRRRASQREDMRCTAGVNHGLRSEPPATEDIAIMRGIPGMTIIDPCDAIDTEQAVPAIAAHNGPVYMRLLRGKVPVVLDQYNYQFTLGKAALLEEGATF